MVRLAGSTILGALSLPPPLESPRKTNSSLVGFLDEESSLLLVAVANDIETDHTKLKSIGLINKL
jgi:hypothetical protein